MLKRVLALLSLSVLSFAILSAQTPAPRSAAGAVRHVILVSVDGLMPVAYTNPDAHGLKVPLLREIAANGVHSPGVRGVYPSVTYPSHTALATGANPRAHGIYTNRPWDPLNRLSDAMPFYTEDIRVPPLWDVARAAGLRTAIVYWPVTVGAKADAIVPEFWRDDATPEDSKLLRVLSTPGLLDTVAKRFPGFWDRFLPPRVTDQAGTDIAVHLIETLRPNLILLHIFDVDHFQHRDGPLAGRGLEAVENADRQLARIIAAAKKAGTWKETALVVVSDHGFVPTEKFVRPGVLLREKGLVTLDDRGRVTEWKAWVLAGGGYAFIYVKDANDAETRRTLLETFQPLAGKPGSGIRRVFTQEEIAAFGADPRAFLALEPADNFGFTYGYTGDLISPATSKGQHGIPPDRPEINASLLIYGPRIGKATLEGARMIDVAPTVARLLGLTLDRAEGQPLPVPLRAAAPR